MPGSRGYTLYKGFRIYVPLDGELPRNSDGELRVHAVISSFPYGEIVLVKVPHCVAASVDEAIGLSVTYAMRLAEDGWWPSEDQEAGPMPYSASA